MDDAENDDDLMNLEVSLESILPGQPIPSKPSRPDESVTWDNQAIQQCFSFTTQAHDAPSEQQNAFLWVKPLSTKEKTRDIVKSFHPPPVNLPLWAVDPFLASYE